MLNPVTALKDAFNFVTNFDSASPFLKGTTAVIAGVLVATATKGIVTGDQIAMVGTAFAGSVAPLMLGMLDRGERQSVLVPNKDGGPQ